MIEQCPLVTEGVAFGYLKGQKIMGKDYEKNMVNERTIPNLFLYTMLIGVSCFFVALSVFNLSIISANRWDEAVGLILFLISCYLMAFVPRSITSLRKSKRDLGAACARVVVFLLIKGYELIITFYYCGRTSSLIAIGFFVLQVLVLVLFVKYKYNVNKFKVKLDKYISSKGKASELKTSLLTLVSLTELILSVNLILLTFLPNTYLGRLEKKSLILVLIAMIIIVHICLRMKNKEKKSITVIEGMCSCLVFFFTMFWLIRVFGSLVWIGICVIEVLVFVFFLWKNLYRKVIL